jgi:hypothetical protein
MRQQLRQGDILVERLDRLPDGLGPAEPDSYGAGELDGSRIATAVFVLAEGEATGHAHRLVAPAGSRFLRATDPRGGPLAIGFVVLERPATVTHDEHAPLTLPPGVWRVTRQRRFDPAIHARAVAD